MGRGYRFIEEWSITDVAFDTWGERLEDLFVASARATFEVMAELDRIEPVIERDISLEGTKPDRLLYDWLAELIYLKDVEGVVFSRFDVTIKKNGNYHLKATAKGESVKSFKGELRTDVKAVTMHMFELRYTDGKWHARVLLDL